MSCAVDYPIAYIRQAWSRFIPSGDVPVFIYGVYWRDMEGTCNRCHTDLAGGGILFTTPGDNQMSQNLCMKCFESMNSGDIQPEQAV
jgi:hypothetical protein